MVLVDIRKEERIGDNWFTIISVYVLKLCVYFLRCVHAIDQQPPPCCHSQFVSEHISTKGTFHFLVGAFTILVLDFDAVHNGISVWSLVVGKWALLWASGRSSKYHECCR